MFHLGFGYGMYGLGFLFVILCIALIVVGIALLVRRPAATAPPASAPEPTTQAQRILEERFARGEIDEAEYRGRLEVLLGTRAWMGEAPQAGTADQGVDRGGQNQ
jgi:putative membrane protein